MHYLHTIYLSLAALCMYHVTLHVSTLPFSMSLAQKIPRGRIQLQTFGIHPSLLYT